MTLSTAPCAAPTFAAARSEFQQTGEIPMRTVRFVCWLALLVGALLCRLDGAGAQGSPEEQQACTGDAMRLCADVMPDVAKITTCMSAKYSQLSEPCRLAMGGGKKQVSHHRYRKYRHCRHCG